MAGEQKAAYIRDMLSHMHTLISVTDDLPELENMYFDNGYGSGGADEIIQTDLDKNDITVAEFTNLITLVQQLKNFTGNAVVTQSDYAATLNAVRHAPTP